jgi:hypothetical protein
MVNIKDFENPDQGAGDKLIQIFNRQKELIQKYHPIEEKNGLLLTKDIPVNIHDNKGQARLKDFAWRVTEELGEALGALSEHPDLIDHYNEEIADALHFLVEFTILSGTSEEELTAGLKEWVLNFANPECSDHLEYIYEFAMANMILDDIASRNEAKLICYTGLVIRELSMTCNTLKNKAWKQTSMLTDLKEFKSRLEFVWVNFIKLCLCANISPSHLFNLYFRKSEVNKFRIRSQY